MITSRIRRLFSQSHATTSDSISFQHAVDQLQHTAIVDELAHTGKQALMIDAVEEPRKIDVDRDAVAFVKIRLSLSNGGLGSPRAAEPMAAVVKRVFKHRFELEQDRLLNHAINDIGNTQATLTSDRFGNSNATEITRLVSSRDQSVTYLRQ